MPRDVDKQDCPALCVPASGARPLVCMLTDARAMSEILTALEIEQLARFDEHWPLTLAGDNRLLSSSLAKRGYLDVQRRRVPLYRLSDLGPEAIAKAAES